MSQICSKLRIGLPQKESRVHWSKVGEGHRPCCHSRNMETELGISGSTYNCRICLDILCRRVFTILNASSQSPLLTLPHGEVGHCRCVGGAKSSPTTIKSLRTHLVKQMQSRRIYSQGPHDSHVSTLCPS